MTSVLTTYTFANDNLSYDDQQIVEYSERYGFHTEVISHESNGRITATGSRGATNITVEGNSLEELQREFHALVGYDTVEEDDDDESSGGEEDEGCGNPECFICYPQGAAATEEEEATEAAEDEGSEDSVESLSVSIDLMALGCLALTQMVREQQLQIGVLAEKLGLNPKTMREATEALEKREDAIRAASEAEFRGIMDNITTLM